MCHLNFFLPEIAPNVRVVARFHSRIDQLIQWCIPRRIPSQRSQCSPDPYQGAFLEGNPEAGLEANEYHLIAEAMSWMEGVARLGEQGKTFNDLTVADWFVATHHVPESANRVASGDPIRSQGSVGALQPIPSQNGIATKPSGLRC